MNYQVNQGIKFNEIKFLLFFGGGGEIQRDFRIVVFVGPFFRILYGYSKPFVAHLPVN